MTVVPSTADGSTAIGCAAHGSLGFKPATPIRPADGVYICRAFDGAGGDAAPAETGRPQFVRRDWNP